MKILILISVLLIAINFARADAVCDLETLKLELRQDLEDNNALDCLRKINSPPDGKESDQQKNKRILSQWDTDCSFESNQDLKALAKELDIANLVNAIGEEVDKDFEDQADMCELIRAAVAANKFKLNNLDMQNLQNTWIDKVDCAGPLSFKGSTRICAASGGSLNQKDSWAFMIGPQNIKFDKKPLFHIKDTVGDENAGQSDKELVYPDLEQMSNSEFGETQQKQNEDMDNFMDMIADNDSGTPQKSEANHSEAHVRKVPTTQFKPENEYKAIDKAVLSLQLDPKNPQMFFGFYIVSFSTKGQSSIGIQTFFGDKEKEEARNIFGPSGGFNSITGAFGESLANSKSKGVSFSLKYKLKGDMANVDMENEKDNITLGGVLMDNGLYYLYKNSNTITVRNSVSWIKLEKEMPLEIDNNNDKAQFFLVLYNFSCEKPSSSIIWTRLTIDGSSQKVIN